jgi:TRAP-type C4-dicarboxylate transport system permease small subunit
MSGKSILGIVLLAAGILALVYGGFTYTKDSHEAKLGPLKMEYKEKEHVDLPLWAGIGAIVVGGALLVLDRRK